MDLRDCTICPRNCHADRVAGQLGYCRQTNEIKAARAALHMWEEPCISGQTGSGTVFFSGCNMGCVFCQNHTISKGITGKGISILRLAEIFLNLQDQGACNINLVTPSHFVPQIIDALIKAKDIGLSIPVVYNTSSYEKVETLKHLEGLVDIYLPDLKYFSPALSKKYSYAENYFYYAKPAIAEMVRQTGDPMFCGDLMTKGVIVRHLALPGYMEDSKAILRFLYETYGDDIYVSIMNQYTPIPAFLDAERFPELNHTLSLEDYEELVDYATALGIENGFIQEGETCSESFIPPFNCDGI